MIYEEVESLVSVLRDHPGLTELEVRSGTRALRLRRAAPIEAALRSGGADVVSTALGIAQLGADTHVGPVSSTNGSGLLSGDIASESITVASTNAAAAMRQIESSLAALAATKVSAELVGVFRAHRSPDLSIGSSVKEGQSLGQIEAMRLLNDCPSPIAGRISAILVQDGEPVEYGQPLFELAELEAAS